VPWRRALGVLAFAVGGSTLAGVVEAGEPGEPGEPGLAILCGKVLTMDERDRIFDRGMILVRDGKIEHVGERVEVPEGYEILDHSGAWGMPGIVEIHSHIVGTGDINDMVSPINPQLSTRPSYRPSNPQVRRACSAGVTVFFGIPGSGTSIAGFGGVYKTKTESRYRETVLKVPGAMKAAFNYNPERRHGDLGTSWCGLSWTVDKLCERARGAMAQGRDVPAYRDLVRVLEGELPVLVHCASAEGVAGLIRQWKIRNGAHPFVSHGSWDGPWAAPFAAEHGIPVNHGPRTMNFTTARREDRIVGGAQSYLDAGVPVFSLTTDAPVVPQEELPLQGAMSARLGADAYQMVRAITTHPAQTLWIDDRVGSLETGKDADIVIYSGDPLDPRSRVEIVLIDGELQYSRERDGQWF
jgi:imidazolonepropionase-like amidohydrolase